jgi:hypothetical protein
MKFRSGWQTFFLLFSFLIVAGIAGLVSGCGPKRSALDQEESQVEKIFQEKSAEVRLAEGVYRGTMKRIQGEKMVARPIVLELVYFVETSVNPGKGTVIEVPTLRGTISLKGGTALSNAFASIEEGSYDPDTGRLYLSGVGEGDRGTIAVVADLVDGQLSGKLFASMVGTWELKLERVGGE